MNVDQSVANRVDLHAGIKAAAKIRGAPQGLIRQDDEVDAINKQQQQQQSQMMMTEAAPGIAGAVKDVAEAAQAGKKN
jgi:hypothetical protein